MCSEAISNLDITFQCVPLFSMQCVCARFTLVNCFFRTQEYSKYSWTETVPSFCAVTDIGWSAGIYIRSTDQHSCKYDAATDLADVLWQSSNSILILSVVSCRWVAVVIFTQSILHYVSNSLPFLFSKLHWVRINLL